MTNIFETGIIAGVDRVRWHSAAGILEGTVKRVDVAKNAAGVYIDWLIIGDITYVEHNSCKDGSRYAAREDYTSRLAATKSCLSMLKLEVVR